MSKSLEFLTTMKELNFCVENDQISSQKFEDSLLKIKSYLLDPEIQEGWISKILSFFVNHYSLRNEYNSLIRDLIDNFKYGKIKAERVKTILLKKDRRGFLIPEITLINGMLTLYLHGYVEDSIEIMSLLIKDMTLDNSLEIAFLLYCLRDVEFFEDIVSTCEKIHKEHDKKIMDENSRYEYLRRYTSNKGLRSKYFSQIFYQSPKENIIKEIFLQAFKSFENHRYLVLVGGVLFSFCWDILSEDEKKNICEKFESFLDIEDENTKADILDLLARYFPEKNYKKQIVELGQKKGAKTFYENTQNIHIEGLDEKIFSYLEKQTLTDCFEEFYDWVNKNGDEDHKEAAKRLKQDASLFMKKYSLQDISSICWLKIKESKDTEELKKRLLQELKDMKDTCFTGHITRLINIFTGFEDNGISIPWEAQFRANAVVKIEKYLRDISGEKKDKLIEQLDADFSEKTLVYDMLGEIIKELYGEFVEQGYLTPKEFDIYSENLINSYVGVE